MSAQSETDQSKFRQNLYEYYIYFTKNIPILPEAFLTFASKSCGPSFAAN